VIKKSIDLDAAADEKIKGENFCCLQLQKYFASFSSSIFRSICGRVGLNKPFIVLFF